MIATAARACVLVGLVVGLWAGCTPARKEIRGDAVRRIRFEGNGGGFSGQNDLQLRGAMQQRASSALTFTWPFSYFSTPARFTPSLLGTDARSLEIWYAHHGFFDAKLLGWEVRRIRARSDERAGIVDVIGHVATGQVSYLRTLDVHGEYRGVVEVVVDAAVRTAGVREGDPFSLDALESLRKRVVEELQENTFAYARADLSIQAFPEQHEVDVSVEVTPGIQARLGAITVEGLTRLDAELVLGAIEIEEGDPFKLSELRDTQKRLFETRLFSIVNVVPDLSDPTAEAVPITLELTEARPRRFRAGVGLEYDYYTLSPRGTLSYRDLRLGGSGLQLEATAELGAIVGVVRDDEGGGNVLLTGAGDLRIRYPWLANGRLTVEAGGRFEQDAQFGTLPYWKVRADVGLRYRFSRYTDLTGGPVFEYYRYLEPGPETLEAARLQFGGDFTGSTYRLLAIDVGVRVDYRDDPVFTRRGSYWSMRARQSIPIPAFDVATTGDTGTPQRGFLYTRLDGDVRGYWPVRVSRRQRAFPVVLAGRLHAIALFPWQAGDALPYPDLAFLGGATSLRGFRTQQVGPYDALCSYRDGRPNPQHNNGEPYRLTRTYMPKGGAFGVEGIGEVRYDWQYGVSFAVFGDVGLLTNRWADISANQIRGGAGLGVRYDTPVGPIRLDIGLRPTFPEDFGPQSYIGCNPVDELPRGYDLLTGGRRVRDQLDDRDFPMAINLFFSIGEAF